MPYSRQTRISTHLQTFEDLTCATENYNKFVQLNSIPTQLLPFNPHMFLHTVRLNHECLCLFKRTPFQDETQSPSFKDAVYTAQKTNSVSVTKTSQLMPYKEIIIVCSKIHTQHRNALGCQQVQFLNVKPCGIYLD